MMTNNEPSSHSEKITSKLDLLNKPAVLWLASAIFISVAGTAFSNSQRCYADAAILETRYFRIGQEIFGRKWPLTTLIESAKGIDDVRAAFKAESGKFLYAEFKDETLAALDYEYGRILNNARPDRDQMDDVSARKSAYYVESSYADLIEATETLGTIALERLIASYFDQIKYIAKREQIEIISDLEERKNGLTIVNCGIFATIERITTRPNLPILQIDRTVYRRWYQDLQEIEKQKLPAATLQPK
jgi:hypothetical protein